MLKYIIVNTTMSSHNVIIFSQALAHVAMARNIPGVTDVVGAGFVDFDTDDNGEVIPRCHGRADSLNIKSCPEDSVIIKSQMSRY